MEESALNCEVDLIGHCAFCRRQLLDSGVSDSIPCLISEGADEPARSVPKAGDQLHLTSFKHIWGHLLGSGLRESSLSLVKYRFSTGEAADDGLLLKIPPLCQDCWEVIEQLDKLHKELTVKVKRIRKIVVESSKDGIYSWRDEELQGKLENSLLRFSVKEGTFRFLRELLKLSSQDTYDDYDYEDDNTDCNFNTTQTRPLSPSRLFAEQTQTAGATDMVHCLEKPTDVNDTEYIVKEEVFSPPPTPGGGYESESDVDMEGGKSGNEVQEDADISENEDADERESGSDYENETGEESSDSDQVISSSDSEYNPRTRRSNRKWKVVIRKTKRGGVSGSASQEGSPQPQPNCDQDQQGTNRRRRSVSYSCTPCDSTFASEKELVNHKSLVHGIEEPFICQKCGKAFNRMRSLENHEKLHTGERNHKCDFPNCDMRYITRHGLAKHKRTAHNKTKKPVCDICGKASYDSSSLRKHVESVHLGIKYECPICKHLASTRSALKAHLLVHTKQELKDSKTFQLCPVCKTEKLKVGEEVATHLKELHNVEELVNCKQCPYIFLTRDGLLEHMYKHRLEGIICDICDDGVKYSKHWKFRHHYFTVHNIGQTYVCDECGKGFATTNSLNTHKKAAHSGQFNNISPFSCEDCGEAFKTEGALITHKIKFHGAEPLKCEACGKTFDRPRSLEDHQKLHLGLKDFICGVDNCGKSYPTSHGLAKHKREKHNNVRPVCDTCGKSFYDSRSLHKHINSIHLKVKHMCHVCGDQLACSTSLKQHMIKHTGEQPFKCTVCSRGFNEEKKMLRHVRLKHETEKKPPLPETLIPHICEICGKSFTTMKNLKRHNLIHTGERPYSCPHCSQPFRQKHAMDAHVKLHETKGAEFKPKGPTELHDPSRKSKKKKRKAKQEPEKQD